MTLPTLGQLPLHSVVMASAGTGKTHQLSTRLIALLAKGAPVGSILATTFTRKAAGEILERVLRRLARAAHDDKERDALGQSLGEPITRDRCRAALIDLVRQSNRLGIMTLDSWMGRIATGFGLDLGLPPGWSIIDDAHDQALRDRAINDALGETYDPRLADVFEALSNGRPKRAVHRHAGDAVASAYDIYLDAAQSREAWDRIAPPASGVTREEAINAMRTLVVPLTRAGTPVVHWSNAVRKIIIALETLDADAVLESTLIARVLDGEPFSRVPIDDAARAAAGPAIAFAKGVCLERLRRRNLAVFDLLDRFHAGYERRKAAAGAMRFDDVPRRLVAASLEGRLDELYYRLDGATHHVLLDEFQDTSRIQYRVLAPVLDEILAVGDASRSMFCVGDVKQSLYAWRGAEPAILQGLPGAYPQIEVGTLARSYRSSPRVLDAVNQVFSTLSANPALSAINLGALWRDSYPMHEANAALPGYACLRTCNAPDKQAGQRPADMLVHAAAERAAALHREAPHATIGVLVRRNARIGPLIHALQAMGIDAAEEGGARLTDSPVVAAALSMLHLASYPGDSAARYHVGTTPLGRIVSIDPCDARTARHAATRLRRVLAREGISAFLARCQRLLAPALSPRDFDRFDRLVDLAREFDETAVASPAAFVELATETTVENAHPAPVRVMTVHASKGLEFDAVVLPDLEMGWSIKPGSILTQRADDPAARVTLATFCPPTHVRRTDADLDALHNQRLARAVDEELCGLYVAMTRARLVLEMIIAPAKSDTLSPGGAKVLRGSLVGAAPVDPSQVLWTNQQSGDESWTKGVRLAPPSDVSPQVVDLRLASRPAPTWKLPGRSPSAAKAATLVDLGELWQVADESAADRGTLLHLWFSLIAWSEDPAPTDEALFSAAAAEGIDQAWAGSILPAFRAACRQISPILSRSRYPEPIVEARPEVPFVVRDIDPVTGEAAVMTGRIDRLVVVRDARGTPIRAEIIDFKSDSVPTSEALSERARMYTPQMQAYRRAASTMLGLEAGRIAATLVFTSTGQDVSV
ncbi:MAG: UvrD-helicase domain-containing protein [Phycisphaerales bacterium]|nr:UvrD-helicase domain-containing protein [Phycisphaerales bacterium]